MDSEAVYSLISVRLQMLIHLFGRKVNEEQLDSMKRVYSETLGRMPLDAISRGFAKAERTCDRMPTPKLMRELCSEFISGGSRYHFGDGWGEDPETKQRVRVKVDQDTGEVLYKAENCPEGREFLATLRRMSRKPKEAKEV